jgi:hypothetical protein
MTTATVDLKKVQTKLAKAKTALILEHPFVGTVALNMPFEFDENIPLLQPMASGSSSTPSSWTV